MILGTMEQNKVLSLTCRTHTHILVSQKEELVWGNGWCLWNDELDWKFEQYFPWIVGRPTNQPTHRHCCRCICCKLTSTSAATEWWLICIRFFAFELKSSFLFTLFVQTVTLVAQIVVGTLFLSVLFRSFRVVYNSPHSNLWVSKPRHRTKKKNTWNRQRKIK